MSKDSVMLVDKALMREIAELLRETDLSEIEVVDGDRRIRVARQMTAAPVVQAVAAAPAAVAAPVAASEPAAPPPAADPAGTLTSPMVGTCYLLPEPGKPPFVSVGATVREGDTVMIIEAMKVMNPIVAHKSGAVTAILVTNEQPVEYGQPLLTIA